jgi:nucleotide-binding universal stress UspA family protein
MNALATRSALSPAEARTQLTLVAQRDRAAPIVAAVDGWSASRDTIDAAVRLASELNTALTFVFVRRGPPGFLGTPFFQRGLSRKMARARRVLDRALRAAARAGVEADGEILEGSPQQRILEFAAARGARLVVVGSRGRKLGRNVPGAIVRAPDFVR